MKTSKEWLVPLIGVLFIVVAIVAFAIGGEPPEAKEGGQKIIDHYVDNKDSIQISSLLVGIAAVLLVFFFGYLRKVLHAAEGERGMLSILVLVGAAIVATGIAIDATLAFALSEAADDIDPAAAQAIEAIWDNDFLPLMVGTTVILFATGISVVRHGALPKWLGWVAIALGLVGVTPIGFAAFLGLGVWIVIVSVMLSLRLRRRSAAPAAPAAPAA
jgi:hypothetical protein